MKRKIIPLLLLILGIVLIVSGVALKINSKNKELKAIEKFNNEINLSEIKEENNKKVDKDKSKNFKTYVKKGNLGDEIALIEIPSIDLKSVIVEGVENEQLKYYIGHMPDTAMAGENGNFVLAGHSSFVYNEIFNKLYKVNNGDIIKITTRNKEFNYIIKDKFIVEPKEVSVLNQKDEEKEITIVTCSSRGEKRLIVKGKIEENL
ncbi:class D sortase [Clostridium fallax]|uniref:Sortase A n=1 Tax=Clostridium fallax TaxID=1533 RepID=A0A1M4XXW1_9CLOT|nr:class D sortase [Clostridium fallax]SHE98397.1 sortase A [Clostridium fallax]SQB06478.1 sortase [Clostridium fallax]